MPLFRFIGSILDCILGLVVLIASIGLPWIIAMKMYETVLNGIKSRWARKLMACAIGISIWFVLGVALAESKSFRWVFKEM